MTLLLILILLPCWLLLLGMQNSLNGHYLIIMIVLLTLKFMTGVRKSKLL